MAIINDTTLRDGEQAPYVAFNTDEKVAIAQLLYSCGADELEIGIPAMGEKECADIRAILDLHLPIRMMTWNRAKMSDLEAALRCGAPAVDLSIPVSDTLIDIKFGGNKTKMLDQLADVVRTAKQEGLFVCIGAEDSSRADMNFLKEVMALGEDLGADRFRYCDTIGILTPVKTYTLVKELVAHSALPIEMHTHNDFGLANANAISGLDAGAVSVNTTVIGIGERAGNASFEQIAMTLDHLYGEDRGFYKKDMRRLVNVVSQASQLTIAKNAPIVGEYIFAHESGIHADGMMKNSHAYEAILPSEVGGKREYPIGKHSGAATLQYHLAKMGIHADKESLRALVPVIRDIVTSRKSVLSDEELMELYFEKGRPCSSAG